MISNSTYHRISYQKGDKLSVYWEGWEGHSYTAKVTEIGTRDVRLELDGSGIFNLETMQQTQPLIGLLVSQEADDPQPQSLLATVEIIEELVTSASGWREAGALRDFVLASPSQSPTLLTTPEVRIAIELSFPESLKRQQLPKIQRLLKTLD